jgi:hypothetical protein
MTTKIVSYLRSGVFASFMALLSASSAAAQATAVLSAHVSPEGTLVAGSGAVSAKRYEAGKYIVTFNQVFTRNCVPVASGGPFGAFVFGFQDQNGVIVWSAAPGALRDMDFTLSWLANPSYS